MNWFLLMPAVQVRDDIDTRINRRSEKRHSFIFGSRSLDAVNYPGLIDSQDDVKPYGAVLPGLN